MRSSRIFYVSHVSACPAASRAQIRFLTWINSEGLNPAPPWPVGARVTVTALSGRTRSDTQRPRGTDHPRTLNTRGILANAYQAAGRTAEAITLHEQNLADREPGGRGGWPNPAASGIVHTCC